MRRQRFLRVRVVLRDGTQGQEVLLASCPATRGLDAARRGGVDHGETTRAPPPFVRSWLTVDVGRLLDVHSLAWNLRTACSRATTRSGWSSSAGSPDARSHR